MRPSERPYDRQDDSELHEALSRLIGLKWHQATKLRQGTAIHADEDGDGAE